MLEFRNLDVWHRATNLNKTIDEMTADFPESQAFGLRCQMRRASASICPTLPKAADDGGDWKVRRFLDVATGSVSELECGAIFDLLRELMADS
jgi:four helix bundle protein